MDWLSMDRLPKGLQKDSRTPWRTPDARGVSQAHYYSISLMNKALDISELLVASRMLDLLGAT